MVGILYLGGKLVSTATPRAKDHLLIPIIVELSLSRFVEDRNRGMLEDLLDELKMESYSN